MITTAELDPQYKYTKNQFASKPKRAETNPRPRTKSYQRGESISALTMFVKFNLTSFSK